jgi:poly-gamma-glutamate capsule biosynthesis protein CapA/YwtB (metallophosphatase superfamily)
VLYIDATFVLLTLNFSVMIKQFLAFISFASSMGFWAQNVPDKQVKLLFVGDVMQHGGQIQGAHNTKKDAYDYRDCFQFVKPLISEADIAIANLEVTHAGKPYKGYPQFSAPPELSEGLVDTGFDVILTCNNHSCDGGGKGVTKTLDVLDKLGVKHTGTFRNKAERDKNYPLIVEKNGLKIAVLNYTYGTNGLSVAAPLIINYIDSAVMKADFKKAQTLGADIVICTMHWGTEYQILPNDYQKKWEAFCYRQGADMVIGGHPHVLQPVSQKTVAGEEKLTAWSLGNFVSNQRDRYTDGGMMLSTTVSVDSSKVKFQKVEHCFTWVFPRQEALVKPYYILPDFDYNTRRADFLDEASLAKMKLFFSDSRGLFAQHAKGTTELFVGQNTTAHQRFDLLLEGYYTVQLDAVLGTDWTKLSPEQKVSTTRILAPDGNYHLVSGLFASPEQAGEILAFWTKTQTAVPQLVFVTPKEVKIIGE